MAVTAIAGLLMSGFEIERECHRLARIASPSVGILYSNPFANSNVVNRLAGFDTGFNQPKLPATGMYIRSGGEAGGSVAKSNRQQAPAVHAFLVGVWVCYWNSGMSSLAIVSTWRARSSRGQEILKTMCLAPASMYSLSRSAQFSTGPSRQYRWTMLMKSAPYR